MGIVVWFKILVALGAGKDVADLLMVSSFQCAAVFSTFKF